MLELKSICRAQFIVITLAKGIVLTAVCGFLVTRIAQKVTGRFSWN